MKVAYLGTCLRAINGNMEFIEHKTGKGTVVEIQSDEVIVSSEQDALDIMANIGYLYDSSKIILHKRNLHDDFFFLISGLAGGILQKFSNYRVQLVVIGDFSQFSSKSLKEFILESNKGHQVNFLPAISELL